MTETGWYNGNQKPVRVGAYKRPNVYSARANAFLFHWWDGRKFGHGAATISRAYLRRLDVSRHQNLPWSGLMDLPWFGLTEEPK